MQRERNEMKASVHVIRGIKNIKTISFDCFNSDKNKILCIWRTLHIAMMCEGHTNVFDLEIN